MKNAPTIVPSINNPLKTLRARRTEEGVVSIGLGGFTLFRERLLVLSKIPEEIPAACARKA
jgi:hypothetical protein